MDSPVRKMQKRNDYNRHKLLRKIKRQRRAQIEQQKVAAEKELKRRLRVTPPKFGDGKEPTLLDADKVRMNEQGLFQDEAGNIVGDSVVLPEFVVNGVDVNRIKKHANTAYNDNVRIGSEIPTYARMYEPDEAAQIATSIPGALISAPILGPGLLKAGDAFLGTTLGRNATQFFTNPYTQAAMFSAGLADTVDRRLIRGQHPDYSENPLMAGIEDVFDASMVAAPAVAGYAAFRNARNLRHPVLDPQPQTLEEQLLLENKLQGQKLLPKLKYTIGDIVDSEGNVNTRNAMAVLRNIVKDRHIDLKSQHIHKRDASPLFKQPTIRHMWESAKTAKSLPTPEGGTKQEQVFAALSHDIGRLLYGVGHDVESRNIIRQYFNNVPQKVLHSVGDHMERTIPFESDFTKALHAADIGSGLSGEQTLARYPYAGYTSSENVTNLGKGGQLGLRETIRTKLNPYFDTMGMKRIPLDATEEEARKIVRENMKLYRHVGRGLSMPVYGDTHKSHTLQNQKNAVALTRQVVGSENFTSDDIFKTMVTHAALDDTGHGKAGFDTFTKTLQGPDEYSGAQPVYTSNTTNVMEGYSGNSNRVKDASAAVGAYVPEVYNDNMSLEDIILANEWPLYDTHGRLHPQYDYETPYLLRTGKSLRQDALKYLNEHLSEYPRLSHQINTLKANNRTLSHGSYGVEQINALFEELSNGRLKNYFDKYKDPNSSDWYDFPEHVDKAYVRMNIEKSNLDDLEGYLNGTTSYSVNAGPFDLDPFSPQPAPNVNEIQDLVYQAKNLLPKDQLSTFNKHVGMITSKKRNVSKDKIIDDLKNEIKTRINSGRSGLLDKFFKYKDEEYKKSLQGKAYARNTVLEKREFIDEKLDIYEKLMKQNGVLPMHMTNEMRQHPYAFTTEGLRKNISKQKVDRVRKGLSRMNDTHQHYVFYGQNGTQLLEDGEILNMKKNSSRNVSHDGLRHVNFTPKMNSLYPFALPFIGYGLNSKDNHKKK